MEVIIRALPEAERLWIAECGHCHSLVRAKMSELTNITEGEYRSDYEDWSWEPCPVCSKKICFHREDAKSVANIQRRIAIELEMREE